MLHNFVVEFSNFFITWDLFARKPQNSMDSITLWCFGCPSGTNVLRATRLCSSRRGERLMDEGRLCCDFGCMSKNVMRHTRRCWCFLSAPSSTAGRAGALLEPEQNPVKQQDTIHYYWLGGYCCRWWRGHHVNSSKVSEARCGSEGWEAFSSEQSHGGPPLPVKRGFLLPAVTKCS